jgi:Tol biopolymer transport system component
MSYRERIFRIVEIVAVQRLSGPRIRQFQPLRRTTALVLNVVAVVSLLVSCAASGGALTGVYVISASGGAPGWIGAPAGAPVWSAAGDRVAWGSDDGMFVAAPKAHGPRRITSRAVAGRPGWSPDGKELAFVDRDAMALTVVSADTGAVRFQTPVANPNAPFRPVALSFVGGPSWAPDGSRLAFTCWDGAGDEVCLVDGDGGNRRQLTRLGPAPGTVPFDQSGFLQAAANTGAPVWSPDGTRLAVAAFPERPAASTGVFVIDPARAAARRISSLVPNSPLLWTPEGDSVVFSASDKGRSDAVLASISGGSLRKLTSMLTDGALAPSLSGDGSRLVVASGDGLVVVALSGKTTTLPSEPGMSEQTPAWSPTGDAIAFAVQPNPIGNYG